MVWGLTPELQSDKTLDFVQQVYFNPVWESVMHNFLLKRVDPYGNYYTNQFSKHQVVCFPIAIEHYCFSHTMHKY